MAPEPLTVYCPPETPLTLPAMPTAPMSALDHGAGSAWLVKVVPLAMFESADAPAAFTARMRYQYCVAAERPLLLKSVALAAGVATLVQPLVPLRLRSRTKPVSLLDASVQVRL